MSYLERIETARNKQTKDSQDEIQCSSVPVNKSLSSIEQAVNKFLGGFTALRSEISQLKDTVLSNTSDKNLQ